ncbi:MAG: hypothetical protein ACJA0S_001122 [Rickettsiales bacterium]|jgi:hypothetical protein
MGLGIILKNHSSEMTNKTLTDLGYLNLHEDLSQMILATKSKIVTITEV